MIYKKPHSSHMVAMTFSIRNRRHACALLLCMAVTPLRVARADPVRMTLDNAMSFVELLRPAAPLVEREWLVDNATGLELDVVSDFFPIAVALVTPSGQTITVSNVASFGGTGIAYTSTQAYGAFGAAPAAPGFHTLLSLPTAVPGTYRIRFDATGAGGQSVPVVAIARQRSAIQVRLIAAKPIVSLGESVAVSLAVFAGAAPVTGATVSAKVVNPMGVVSTIALLDSGQGADASVGDGLYSAEIFAGQPGMYRARALAEGVSAGGAAFRRSAGVQFEVVAGAAQILPGEIQPVEVDTDGDGLIDRIDFTVPVSIDVAGTYAVTCSLRTIQDQNRGWTARGESALTPGVHQVIASIPARYFMEAQIDELNYKVKRIFLDVMTPHRGFVQVDSRETYTSVFDTPTYLELERPPIWIRSIQFAPFSSNGLPPFQSLRGTVKIYVTQSGTYQWDAKIGPACWPRYFKQNFPFALSATTENAVNIVFDGAQIGRSGFDGPFRLNELDIYMPGASYSLESGLIRRFADIPNTQWPEHTPGDCNNNGIHDRCDLRRGSPDCNSNGLPDECDPDCDFDGLPDVCDPPATDCDGNGRRDYCDRDCRGNGQVDACETTTQFSAQRTFACTAVGCAAPTFTLTSVPAALTDVTLNFTNGRGDFNSDSEYLTIFLNGTSIGRIFELGGVDCGSMAETVIVPRATFNSLLSAGNLTVTAEAPTGVNPAQCTGGWSVQLNLSYTDHVPDVCILGDMNCNGVINVADIGPFVLAVTNPTQYLRQFVRCNYFNADMNGNGVVNVADIGIFVALLGQG